MAKYLFTLLLILSFFEASASIEDYYRTKVLPSASNYGNTGIWEIPTARLSNPAVLRFNFSSSYPFEYTSITGTPFEWLEATYRYSEIKNAKYGPSSYSGNQSLKDKGFDLKVRLLKEDYYYPSVALGIRDLAGTGLFSSEYLVATKKIRNLDLTLGYGWGLLGKESGLSNPFKSFNENFKERRISSIEEGGEFSYKQWFSGETSFIGGIEYDLPAYGTRFKLEYDTSEPDLLPNGSGRELKVDSRFNIGLTYFLSDSLNVSASFERGNQYRISFSLVGNFYKDTIKKPSPKNVVKLNQAQKENIKNDKNILYRSLNKSLRDESIYIQAADYSDNKLDVAVASSSYFSMTRVIGRSARVANALAPDDVEEINIHSMNGDVEVAIFSLPQKTLDSYLDYKIGKAEFLDQTNLTASSDQPLYKRADFQPEVSFPEIEWSMSPSVRHQIGGPEGFYLGQLSWQTDLSVKFKRNISLYSSFGINIYDTFEGLNNPSQSSIPHVRSDIQKYLEEGKNHLKRFQLEYLDSPMKDLYVRADLGIFEEMFGGIGGEVLYRPFHRKFAFGFTLHKVKQRNYDQRFSFIDYETTTGHFNVFADLPSGVLVKTSIGKYLAGDRGLTLDLSRRFNTGFTLGVFATKTNLSKEEFGEGSFDKGFYFSIPTKLFYPNYRSGNISFGLHPLTKDGGSFLNVHHSLYGIVGDTTQNAVYRDMEDFLQ